MLFVLLLMPMVLVAQRTEERVYKTVAGTDLTMQIMYPEAATKGGSLPGMIFFHGGGWSGGSPEQFANQGRYFARRGLLCFLPEYRLAEKHGATPFQSLEDAKSAIRYVKQHAADFGLDSSRVIAAGGSAGGHLAAATALVAGYNSPHDPPGISPVPVALVLFNPVIDNGPGGYGYKRVGTAYKNFSPLHNLRAGAPPTLIMLGTKDQLVPVETARYYQTVMQRLGNRCDLELYPGQKHAFFNHGNAEYYRKTILATDMFLVSLGLLPELPGLQK